MKIMMGSIIVLLAAQAQAQELIVDSGGTNGLCLTNFAQNAPERICMTIRPDGKKIVSKPKPVTGCVLPWTLSGTQCIAILRVAKVPTP